MNEKKNTLTIIRDTYAGPWPTALLSVVLLILAGHAVSVFILGAESSLNVLAGNIPPVVSVVCFGFWIKSKYPNK